MQEIDRLIDEDTNLALQLVEFDIRNQRAHNELQSFNNSGEFQYVHKLTIERRFASLQLSELQKMKKENPDLFLNEITNIVQNIRRIESNIRTKKYKSPEELKSWSENLTRAKIRHEAIKQLMAQ